MTREEKITAIYKEMANKEVSFGCRYEHNGSRYVVDSGNYRLMKHGDFYCLYVDAHCNCPIEITKQYNDFSNQGVAEIIGHPVMIGDVIYYIRKKYWNNHSWFHSDRSKLVDLRSKEREPIEGQYDECINYVYSLFKS